MRRKLEVVENQKKTESSVWSDYLRFLGRKENPEKSVRIEISKNMRKTPKTIKEKANTKKVGKKDSVKLKKTE